MAPSNTVAKQPDRCLCTMTSAQRVMGNRQRHARQQQQCRVDGRDRERTHGAEAFNRTGRTGVTPVRGEVRPQNLVIQIAQPRHGDGAGIKQGAEESSKEHYFGENEPAHAPAERQVDTFAIQAGFGFADGFAEPLVQYDQYRQNADGRQFRTPCRAIDPCRSTDHRDQQRHPCQHRPPGWTRDEIIRRFSLLRTHFHLPMQNSNNLYRLPPQDDCIKRQTD